MSDNHNAGRIEKLNALAAESEKVSGPEDQARWMRKALIFIIQLLIAIAAKGK